MKNPNGFGTVYKLSGNRRKKWRAVKTINWENGKQKRVTVGYFETKQEALKILGGYIYNPNANLTIKNVYEMWSKNHSEKVTEKRKNNITSLYNKHISEIENYIISEINLKDLQDFFDNLNSSSGTITGIRTILNMIFEYALKNDYITKNPIKFIELKKYKTVYEKKEFTDEEIQILWDNVNIPYVDTILILIYTGMRISELLNLKNIEINITGNIKTIYISKSKSTSGIRYIPILDKILPLITKNMKYDNEYLFMTENKKIGYHNYRYIFNNVLKSLGIYPHTPHECRHTTATLLSNAGANPISISKIMGHSNYTEMTAKVYTHKNTGELEKAIKTLN